MLALVGTAAYAQKDAETETTVKGSQVAAGTFYMYNVSAKKYLCASGAWDTHAELENVPAQQIFVSLENGKYNLGTHLKGNWNNYFGNAGGAPYMDRPKGEGPWDLVEAEADGYVAYYVINNAGQYLSLNGREPVFTATADATSLWVFFSLDEWNAAMEASVPEEGVEATQLIQNAGFQLNSQFGLQKWTITNSGGNVARGRSGGVAHTQEFWNNTFDINQTIANAPNGRYALRVQGFNRINNNPNQSTPNDAFYYANDVQANLMPIGTHDKQYDGDYAVDGKWATNSQGGAGDYMLDGGYQNSFITFDVTDNTILFGAKRTSQEGVCWTVLDNFELKFMGNEPILKELIEKAKNLLFSLDEQNKPALEEAIAAAQAVLDNKGDQAAVIEAIQALQDAYNDADALNIAKNLAKEVLAGYDSGKYAYAWKVKLC